ncbi:MAG: PilX N-terminal domain-containing pilus assembly protein [Pseudomonadota bacterium]
MKTQSIQKQQGVALVISLIILVSLTMLGLTAIQRTTTDLSMAGNQRETGLMFQSAEIGLVTAEDYIETSTTNADFSNTSLGLYTVLATDTSYYSPDYFDNASWTGSSQTAATSLNAYEQPRYMIEYLGDRSQNALAAVNIGSYGTQQTGDVVSIYRSTARGTGLTGNSFRYVQSYFGKIAP